MSEKQTSYGISDNISRTMGKEAQRNNILAAKIVSEIVRTTLGPKGMDKMLVDSAGNIVITNDGVTILEEMEIDHPAAKIIVDIAKTQEIEVGDGTTSVAMLAGKLLEEAEKLIDKKIHPTIIVKGYKISSKKCVQLLEDMASPVKDRNILKQIALTAMTGKSAESDKEHLAEIIVGAVERVANGNEASLENIKIQKIKGESSKESELVEGIVIDKERANSDMPYFIDNPKILLLDCSLELRSPESEAKISVSTPDQLQSFLESEEIYLKKMADSIISSGAKAVFCQKGIDDVIQYYLAKSGIFACRRVSKSDMELIARATGGRIVSRLSEIDNKYFGRSLIVEESKKGEDSLVYIKGCNNPRAVSIVIRGGTLQGLEEVERAVMDALGDVISAVKSGKVVAGGGAVEVDLSKNLRAFAKTLGGREQLAVDSFANALECIPEALAENAGLDSIEVLAEMKKMHESGFTNYGLNLFNNKIEDTFSAGIIEPLKVKTQAINSAAEAASMILRIDDVLISKGSNAQARKVNNDYGEMD